MTIQTVADPANLLSAPGASAVDRAECATGHLKDLSPDQLKVNEDAARIVGRLTRRGSVETEPVRVAAFNSYI